MTDDEREALMERMAIAAINARRAAPGAPPVTDNVVEWLRTAPQRTTEIEAKRAALSAAEPVVRADERELCCKALVAMSDVEPHPARSAALVAGASTIRLVAAHHGRARGAAADAYTETEAKPGKVVQIAILNESDSKHAYIFALCEDGRLFGKRLSRNDDEWWLEKSLPVALPVKREGG